MVEVIAGVKRVLPADEKHSASFPVAPTSKISYAHGVVGRPNCCQQRTAGRSPRPALKRLGSRRDARRHAACKSPHRGGRDGVVRAVGDVECGNAICRSYSPRRQLRRGRRPAAKGTRTSTIASPATPSGARRPLNATERSGIRLRKSSTLIEFRPRYATRNSDATSRATRLLYSRSPRYASFSKHRGACSIADRRSRRTIAGLRGLVDLGVGQT